MNNGIVCVLDRMSTKPKKRVNAVPYLYWYQWKQHYRAVCVLCVCVMSLCLNIVNWVDFFFVSFVWCFCVWWFGLIQFVDILEELIVNFSIKVYYFVFCVKFVFFILLDESNLSRFWLCVSLKFSCVLNAFFFDQINQTFVIIIIHNIVINIDLWLIFEYISLLAILLQLLYTVIWHVIINPANNHHFNLKFKCLMKKKISFRFLTINKSVQFDCLWISLLVIFSSFLLFCFVSFLVCIP